VGADRAARRQARASITSPSLHRALTRPSPRRQKRGDELVLSGTFSGYRVAYLATDRDLGVIAEIFSPPADADTTADATSP
jgi:hypothetical protein